MIWQVDAAFGVLAALLIGMWRWNRSIINSAEPVIQAARADGPVQPPNQESGRPPLQVQERGWNPEERLHRATERRYWCFSLLLSGAIAAGAAVSAYFAYRAVIASQAAADASRDAAGAAERQADAAEKSLPRSLLNVQFDINAIIHSDAFRVDESGVGTVYPGRESFRIPVMFCFHNYGQLTASIVGARASMFAITDRYENSRAGSDQEVFNTRGLRKTDELGEVNGMVAGTDIAAGGNSQSVLANFFFDNVAKKDPDLLPSMLPKWLLIDIHYRDINGPNRESSALFLLRGPTDITRVSDKNYTYDR